MAAMCGLHNYQNSHIFVVFKTNNPYYRGFYASLLGLQTNSAAILHFRQLILAGGHLFLKLFQLASQKWLPKYQIGLEHLPTVPIFLEPWYRPWSSGNKNLIIRIQGIVFWQEDGSVWHLLLGNPCASYPAGGCLVSQRNGHLLGMSDTTLLGRLLIFLGIFSIPYPRLVRRSTVLLLLILLLLLLCHAQATPPPPPGFLNGVDWRSLFKD